MFVPFPSPSDFIKIGEGNKIAGGKSKKEREIKLENSSLILYDVILGNPRYSRVSKISQDIPEYPGISKDILEYLRVSQDILVTPEVLFSHTRGLGLKTSFQSCFLCFLLKELSAI